MTGTGVDASELLDVDVDQLARTLALIANSGPQAQPTELAHPDPGQDPRDGRHSHVQALGDLSASHPQTPQRRDHVDTLIRRARGTPLRCRGAIQQPMLTFQAKASDPLAGRALADPGGLRRPRQRPTLPQRPINQQLAPLDGLDAEASVSVKLHPVSSLVLGG